MDNKLLEVKNLQVSIKTYRGEVQAVRDVSFSIEKGEVFCIVGESGCGKSVTAQTLMKLNPSPPTMIKNGEILLNGKDIVPMNKHEMKSIRGREISMIFQDPMTSLNPTQRIGKQIEEAVRVHETVSEQEARQRAISMLEKVGVPGPEERILQYPHEFSGGMRQRVMIAMGLACDPQLLIADEPTTALDVTIQAQILELIKQIQQEKGISVLLITHDLGVVANMADKEKLQERLAKMAGGVAVLYVGAPSEVEMKEKKDRVDDALHATRAAIEEGTVPGGGVAYIRAIEALEGLKGENEDETTGIEIVKRAIEEPLRQIVANAGKEGAVVVQKVKEGKGDFGYNARTDKYENLCAAGVIDPAKVTRVALENAASIAGMFLTTECVIAEKKEEAPAAPAMNPGMGGMGGMM